MNKSHECFNLLLIISISICLLAPFSCDKVRTNNATYYVDSWGGDDGRDGKSSVKAWRSLKNVNTTEFLPGDSILFKCNGIWSGQLWPKGSGKK
ncbi:coagulation factor 5/8 type domain-containing protein, partial [Candidatus Pacearchaeota archaeon]|nr:coagulation factor 5/8 type domain-containing protein [Candidatus Pacearchaeota archaeon]